MAIMSFAHLKKQTPTAQPDPPAMKKSEPAVKEVSDSGSVAVDPLALLMESKFCYGCEAFSVDAPDKSIWIKEHLRGIRQFFWKGNSCSVIAPKFHIFNMDEFTAPSTFVEDGMDYKKEKFMDMDKVVGALVEMEKTQQAVNL